jgi:Cu(I)/Ag(I) efflux system membrane protein CusA/SilA
MPNWWLMPIQTRIGMITTGMRGYLGLKVYGMNLKDIQQVAVKIEDILKKMPETTAVSADRPLDGFYLEIKILKDECARFGLTSDDVAMYIETAIGGMNISETIEGRFRFPINLRYPPELRDDPEKIKRILIHTPQGYVPLGQLAQIKLTTGPPMIKSENALLVSYIPVDFEPGISLGEYVSKAEKAIKDAQAQGRLVIPAGTYYKWSGQYEFMERVKKRLMLIIPITLIIIFILLYFATKNTIKSLIAMISLPFALTGGIWFMFILNHNWSLAAGMGLIALAGLAAETVVITYVFLDLAFKQREPKNLLELNQTVVEGAVMRIRPKIMTVMTTTLALAPIMFVTGAGASAMQRLAAPMIGGLVTSMLNTLVLIPVFYGIYKAKILR